MNSKEKKNSFFEKKKILFTCNDVEDFLYKEIFFHNWDIDIEIDFDEFYYFDVDQVEIMNEIFDYINHIYKLKKLILF
jgi:hypothetical protein